MHCTTKKIQNVDKVQLTWAEEKPQKEKGKYIRIKGHITLELIHF